MKSHKKNLHGFRNISLRELLPYMARFHASAWVSLLHRVSGGLLFLLLPLIIWTFDASLASESSFVEMLSVLEYGFGFAPGWLLKLTLIAILWAYLHHLFAGIRFLVLDIDHRKLDARKSAGSARSVLVCSVLLTFALALKIFGLY